MAKDPIELQHQIRQAALHTHNEINNLKSWEKEMAIKETEFLKQSAAKSDNGKKPPIRSKINEFQKFASTQETLSKVQSMSIDECEDNRTAENQADDVENKRKEAADFKEKGNTFVKSKEFESAIKMYTRAIELYNQDPVFYSNRSQCYLKLEKYHETIDDASRAIELDPENFKAFYRRMVAYEKIGDDYKALKNCRKWLDLCPNDKEAEKCFDKIHNRIAEIEKKKDKEKIRWSKFGSRATPATFVNRPPHLRSKKPMKTIPIGYHKAASPIPSAVIDRIFDNNTGETNPHPETDSKLFKPNFLSSTKNKVLDDNAQVEMEQKPEEIVENSVEERLPDLSELEQMKCPLITTPNSGPQFVSVWKELNEIQKFLYLKNIVDSKISVGKVLGAQLDSEMLSEIILVLEKYFPHYSLPFMQVLHDLKWNSEISMLVMFLENEDKKRLNNLINNSNENGAIEMKNFYQL